MLIQRVKLKRINDLCIFIKTFTPNLIPFVIPNLPRTIWLNRGIPRRVFFRTGLTGKVIVHPIDRVQGSAVTTTLEIAAIAQRFFDCHIQTC
ncbi:hypothetical protein ACEUBL_18280 [Aeromonas veronii]|uniref:hypothetical protein n=1 Tax=Aeromonas veronii TaxID=654 RepID=UPI0038D2991D